jgi:hypothetical protein
MYLQTTEQSAQGADLGQAAKGAKELHVGGGLKNAKNRVH